MLKTRKLLKYSDFILNSYDCLWLFPSHYLPMQYVLWIHNILIINMYLYCEMPSGDKRGTKNCIPKERKTIKPFQKNYTEMSGTLFVPHPLVLLVLRIEC